MDRQTIIDVQTRLLLRVVARMVAMLPGGDGILLRRVYLVVLSMLRPAESAARRVIAIAETLVTITPSAKRKAQPKGGIPKGDGEHIPAFPLFDLRLSFRPRTKRVAGIGPRIRPLDGTSEPTPPPPPAASPDDIVDGATLMRRIAALRAALENVPKQAQRLARQLAGGRTRYRRVMRPGRPPGHRERGRRAVDYILADCQSLALMVLHEVAINNSS